MLFRSLDSKFIFIGDYYQLPSVSQGQVLKDMIDSEVLDVIKLNNLYRQKDGNYIIDLAHEIKNKELSDNFGNFLLSILLSLYILSAIYSSASYNSFK